MKLMKIKRFLARLALLACAVPSRIFWRFAYWQSRLNIWLEAIR